jgi:hypothetical protein
MKLSIASLMFCATLTSLGQTPWKWEDGAIRAPAGDVQIEVGGPLAGAEFHGGRPLPSRISLYAPVANSIDLSTDYWRRGESRPVVLGIRVDGEARRWLGKESWEYVVAPQRVRFERREGDLRLSIRYEFGVRDVAMVTTMEITNEGTVPHALELYAHYALVLRSCQSYQRFAASRTRFDRARNALIAEFDDVPLARASLFVQNAGAIPSSWSAGTELAVQDSGWSAWIEQDGDLSKTPLGRGAPGITPAAAFVYRTTLKPGMSWRIVQLLGSTARKEAAAAIGRAAKGWQKELRDYAGRILAATHGDAGFHSGEPWTDNAVTYSRALLAANQHYLDGSLVPMPCPAEYNFFFTHDALLTDLSAVLFDPARVKRDLLYLAKRAKKGDLPHAYYWKDDGFKTEFCNPGNWNNLWVILATAAYYRHTSDRETALRLHPLLTRALEKTLTMRKGNLMHGVEPDWWDFGSAPGARAYLTILTARALEEYVYLSSRLGKTARLAEYEQASLDLRRGLLDELWDGNYLYNTTPAGRDTHTYMGPLLASVFGLLPREQATRLAITASTKLLDPLVGLRTVAPADFHTDSVKKFYNVKSNEAGDQYRYANGGIWYLGNAWYAWALRAIGNIDGAFEFYRRMMTLDGILQSPRGQPALYEYRYADTSAADYGLVDKPTMMWSAGFCIGTAYRIAGFEDNVWNVTVGSAAPPAMQNVRAAYFFGGPKTIERRGKGSNVTRLAVDNREIPSRILPLDAASGSAITVEMGPIRYPFLDSANAVLHSASFDPGTRIMQLVLSSYEGHETSLQFLTPSVAQWVRLNDEPWTGWKLSSTPFSTLIVHILYRASAAPDKVTIQF